MYNHTHKYIYIKHLPISETILGVACFVLFATGSSTLSTMGGLLFSAFTSIVRLSDSSMRYPRYRFLASPQYISTKSRSSFAEK